MLVIRRPGEICELYGRPSMLWFWRKEKKKENVADFLQSGEQVEEEEEGMSGLCITISDEALDGL